MSRPTLVPGGTTQAICMTCKAKVTATYGHRDVPFSDGLGLAKSILVAICDGCNEVIGLPAQSTAKIREARQALLSEKSKGNE